MQTRTLKAIGHDTFGGIKVRRGATLMEVPISRICCLLRMGMILEMLEAARIE